MIRTRYYALIVLGWLATVPTFAPPLPAQEPAQKPAMPEPQKEHQWLQRFVGTWDLESEASMGPEQPPERWKGTVKCHMLGGFWLVNEWQGGSGEMQMTGMQTIGYDTTRKQYVGTWVDSMTDHLWNYTGFIEEDGKKIVLEATGPNMMLQGKETRYRDAYAFASEDEMTVTSSMLGEDGKWITFMTGTAKRR